MKTLFKVTATSITAFSACILLLYCSSSNNGNNSLGKYVCEDPSYGGWTPPSYQFSDGSTGQEYVFDTGFATPHGERKLKYVVFHPQSLICSALNPCPVVLLLPGGGGDEKVAFRNDVREAAAEHGFLALSVTNRVWPDFCVNGNTAEDCEGQEMVGDAYVDSPHPDIGPGEQDILRGLDHFTGARSDAEGQVNSDYAGKIDPDRIYLAGFSMGGRGTYSIGLRNPDRFAALGPMAAPSDFKLNRLYRPYGLYHKEAIAGGPPGGPVLPNVNIPAGYDPIGYVNTIWTITSGRFLIENAANLPIFQTHGDRDGFVPNDAEIYTCKIESICNTERPFCGSKRCEDYENSKDLSINVGDDQWCAGNELSCVNNWPNAFWGSLADLRLTHPGLYSSESVWTPGPHCWNANPSPEREEDVRWVEFLFSRFKAVKRPGNVERVIYKSYTDTHTRAYWAAIEIVEPWTDQPGIIIALQGENSLDLALYRVQTVTLDLDLMDFDLSSPGSITLTVSGHTLNEQEDPRSGVRVRFTGFPHSSFSVTQNDLPFLSASWESGMLTLSEVTIDYLAPNTYKVSF
jgi:pimeloyl-ACP methyl ester carboxylesterase